MSAITEAIQKYQAAITAKQAVLTRQAGLETAHDAATEQKPLLTKALADARAAYSEAVVASPGSEREASARATLQGAKQALEALEDRLEALGEAILASQGGNEAFVAQTIVNELGPKVWQAVMQAEIEKLPTVTRDVLVRSFAASIPAGESRGGFGGFLAQALGDPTPDELDKARAGLMKTHKLVF